MDLFFHLIIKWALNNLLSWLFSQVKPYLFDYLERIRKFFPSVRTVV